MKEKMKRVQLDFSEEFIQELEQIQVDTGLVTRKDLFDNALTFFQWAVEEIKEGNKVGYINSNNQFSELVMPSLKKIKKTSINNELKV